MNIPADGTVVWMRTVSRSARAVLLAVAGGDLVHLRFDDPTFNCDGLHEAPPAQPFRVLRTAAFFAALERVEKESSR